MLRVLGIDLALPESQVLQGDRFRATLSSGQSRVALDIRRDSGRWLVRHPNRDLEERVRSDLERQQVLGHFPEDPEVFAQEGQPVVLTSNPRCHPK